MERLPLTELRRRIDQKRGERQAARLSHKKDADDLRVVQGLKNTLACAVEVAQSVSKSVQEEAHKAVGNIVSRSLAAVFGEDAYEFKIMFEQRRGKTEAVLMFERGDVQVDPMTASGGGIVDVASFTLRLSCLLLSQPPVRRVMVLDEPFRFLSAEYRPRVVALLESLSRELEMQFIVVTHFREFQIGKVVDL